MPGETISTFWTIYDHPTDYPDHFVVRRCRLLRNGSIVHDLVGQLADSLDEARTLLPPGLDNTGRMPGDDVKIVEVWI